MAEETGEGKVKKQARSITPRKAVDILAVAGMAGTAWEKSGLTLKWITLEKFAADVRLFRETLEASNKNFGERRVITQSLAELNAEIDGSLKYVKSYIAEEYGSSDPAFYAQFGIVKENKMYVIPRDNDRRMHSLQQMVVALGEHEITDRRYGSGYWEGLRVRFYKEKMAASNHDSTSAGQTSVKSDLKAQIMAVLDALVFLVKANYPNSWKEELRVWGFQKEKY